MPVIRHPDYDKLESEIFDLVEKMGFDVVGVELVGEGGRTILRVYIDCIGGVNISDCEQVSRRLSTFLDENYDYLFDGRYYLEVSSPGVNRPIFKREDYERFIGKRIKVKLLEPLDDKRGYTGKLLDVDNEGIRLLTPDGDIFIKWKIISKSNLVGEAEF